ncbi:MAG: hypothetical protein HY814_05225 [Candidatus Riflebacteria bacterium]|nr:hypothetical protein [Candidatus Riflebacteria bacterium]
MKTQSDKSDRVIRPSPVNGRGHPPAVRRPKRTATIREGRGNGTGMLSRDLRRLVRLLRSDPQLQFLRGDRDLLLAGLERALQGQLGAQEAVQVADLAREVASDVVTPELRQETRELFEDALRFRVWRDADHRALVTAHSLASVDEPKERAGRNPLWLSVLTLSIEDMVALEGALRPLAGVHPPRASAFGEPEEEAQASVAIAVDGASLPRHYLFQPLFRAAHRAARLITADDLSPVLPLYEILPMFLAVFQVWAEQSSFGKRPLEALPSLHRDVLDAFERSARRTVDEEVQVAIAVAVAESAAAARDAGKDRLHEQITEASQFSAAFPWRHNPVATQLLLKLCSCPEMCCVGPGAAEALKLAADPTVTDYYHCYGQALFRRGEFRAAGRVYASGLEFLGNHWQGLLDLAQVYRALGQEKVARRVFREALTAPDITPDGQAAIQCEMAGISRGMHFTPPL